MTQPTGQRVTRPGELAALAGGGLLLAAAVGAYPTWASGGAVGMAAMAGAMGIVLFAFLAGLPLVLMQAGKGPQAIGLGFLMSSPVRLLLSLGLMWVVRSMTGWPMVLFFLWVVAGYLVLLAAESIWLARLLKADVRETKQDGTGTSG